jgi:uncharacterized membrane protein YhaH (DUF805 family)
MHWYSDVIRRYADFDGRAGRPEFWWLAVFLPGLGVDIRRLHDTDRSGWWVLLGLIPLAGGLALLVLFALAGTPGPNRYGPSPSATPVEQVAY